jgi:hypothetical protein
MSSLDQELHSGRIVDLEFTREVKKGDVVGRWLN